MKQKISIKDIDELIAHLCFQEKTQKSLLLKTIHKYFLNEQDISKIKSIKATDIIFLIWPVQEGIGEKEKKAHIKAKKKALSSLKSQVNHMCRDFFWEGKNPLRIGVGRFNTFQVLSETKYEEVQRLNSQIIYLENIVSDLAPERVGQLKDKSMQSMIERIQKTVAKRKEQGLSFETAAELPFAESVAFLDEESDKKLKESQLANSKLVIDANEQTGKLADKLSELNQKAQSIYQDIAEGKIAQAEGDLLLEKNHQELLKISKVAQKLTDTLGNIEDQDPVLAKTVENIKKTIKEFIKDAKHIEDVNLDDIWQKGLAATKDIAQIDKQLIDDGVEFENRQELEKEFLSLKTKAKEILAQVKPLTGSLKVLLKQKTTLAGLTVLEAQELAKAQSKLLELQNEGKIVLERLKKISLKVQGSMQEAITFIISALERFLEVDKSKKEVLVTLKKQQEAVLNLKEEGKQLDVLAQEAKEKIVDVEDEELLGVEQEYKKIEKDIASKKHSLKEAKQKLQELEEAKDALDYEQAEAKKILEAKQRQALPLTEEEIENSKIINKIKAETQRLIVQLEQLNSEAASVYQDMEAGRISQGEGEKKLQEIAERKKEVITLSQALGANLAKVDNDDPVLSAALKKIKESLSGLIKEGKKIDETLIEDIVNKGIDALKEFEAADKKDIKDNLEFADRETIEKEFLELKKEAKTILNEFKVLNVKVTPLIKKKNSLGGLSAEEIKELQAKQQELMEIQNKGEVILTRLREIKNKSEGAIHSAAILIISALEKFFKLEDSQREILQEAGKEDDALAELKEGQKALNNFSGRMWERTVHSTAAELLHNENPSFGEKVQHTKTSSHRLALQMDMLINESSAALVEGADQEAIAKNIEAIKMDTQELAQSLDRASSKGKKVVTTLEELAKGEVLEETATEQKETLIDSILLLSSESKQLAAKLKELDAQHEKLQLDIKSRQLNIIDAQRELAQLEEQRSALVKQATQMKQKIDLMEKELADDANPKLAEATSLIRKSLQNLLEEEGFTPDALAEATKRSIEAIKDFQKADDKFQESKEGAAKEQSKMSSEEKEALMKLFAPLKEEAKQIILSFREMDKRMKVLENKSDISDEEKKEYAAMHVKWRDNEMAGKQLISGMEEILSKADGALKESANFVLSSMTRYIRDVMEVPAARLGEKINDGKVIVLNLEKGSKDLDSVVDELKKSKDKTIIMAADTKEDSSVYFKSVFSKEEAAQKEFSAAEKQLEGIDDQEKELKAEFMVIKEEAKNLIAVFRNVDKQIVAAHTKEKDQGTLSEQEQADLAKVKKERLNLEEKGKKLIADLENLSAKCEGPFKESAKLIISSMKKFITDIKEVFVDQIAKLQVKEKVAVPGGFEIAALDVDSLTKTKQSLNELVTKLKEGGGFLEALGDKYFPYEEEIDEKAKEEVEKLATQQRIFKEKVKFLTENIEKLVSSMKEEGLDKDEKADGGVGLLKASIEAMQRGDTKASLEKIAGAINQFESLEERMNFLSQSHIGKKDPLNADKASINIIKGKEGLNEELIEVGGQFFMDRYPITIAQYKSFVVETGYKTEAERNEFGWVYQKQGWLDTSHLHQRSLTLLNSSSLAKVRKASWSLPDGGNSNALDLFSAIDYPAVHLTYNDAKSYAAWAWKRLPTEEEWKFATGMQGKAEKYPWGNDSVEDRCNYNKSNFKNMAPVNFFKPNVYGVYDMIGNIWEWCETGKEEQKVVLGGCWNMPLEELAYIPKMVLAPNIANNTIGFRCVRDIPR